MKKAIILAAGIGSRLRPITEYKPKALVEVNGTPILGHTLNALLKNDVDHIVILTGYLSGEVKSYCESAYPDKTFTYIENSTYDTTNNLFSLYLARQHLKGDCLVMNGDLVFDASIIKKLLAAKGTCVAVDVGRYIDESMKVTLRGDFIEHISKQISKGDAFGCSIDIYKFASGDMRTLTEELEKTIKAGTLTEWTEAALDRLFSSSKIKAKALDIGGAKWWEIDNIDDLHTAEIIFNKRTSNLKKRKIFFVDYDGTLGLGEKLFGTARLFIDALRKEKKTFYISSNNSSLTPKDIAARIQKAGLPIDEKHILISSQAAAAYLKKKGIQRVFWVANKKADVFLKSLGLTFDTKKPQALLLCYDTEITYQKVTNLIRLIRAGVPYFATHIDKVCPTPDGPIPDIGLFIEMIEKATGKKPVKTFGKPDKNFVEPILKVHKYTAKDAVVIGDRLYTDMAMARASGALGVLVLSGDTDRAEYEASDIRADIIVKDVGELEQLLK